MERKFQIKGIVASGMVLQQNKINCVFGTAGAYEDIYMTFRGMTSITQADETGNWKIEFSPGQAGGPFNMLIKSEKENVTFNDVYVGEVWVNSGQSNAQLPMERMRFSYPEEFELPENPYIRMITIPISWTFHGERDYVENPVWQAASPSTIGQMSGTGYFFAKKLSQELNVPVGIINASQGGSPISAWMSKSSLQEMGANEYIHRLEIYEKDENIAAKQKELTENQTKWDAELWQNSKNPCDDKTWQSVKIPGFINEFDSAGLIWLKKEIELSAEQVKIFNENKTWLWLGTIVDADTVFVNGTQVGSTAYVYPPRRYVVPQGVLKEGKNTILMHVQKNSKFGKIRFYEEKPYCLFTENIYVNPVVCRNVEKKQVTLLPLDGELIDLSGEWQMQVDVKVRDCPPGMFFEWVPTALYNAMLAPCFNHAVAGVLWYQGESDAGHPAEYKNMLVKMINLWRKKFVYGSKKLPFVVMQLPNWSDGNYEDSTIIKMDWPYMRQAQADACEIAGNCGVAVTIDAGEWNDLHPEKKQTGGTRAALEALRLAYEKKFICASPRFNSVENKKNKIIVSFDLGNSSLCVAEVSGKEVNLEKTHKKGPVYGFCFLAEKKGKFTVVETKALLEDNQVIVDIPRNAGNLTELRYLWADNPATVNLYSQELLPAMPFKVDL